MSRILEFKLKSSPQEMLASASEAARQEGMEFFGDAVAGRFEGRGVEGSYRVEGETISIQILKKPFIVPWAMVESAVRTYFA